MCLPCILPGSLGVVSPTFFFDVVLQVRLEETSAHPFLDLAVVTYGPRTAFFFSVVNVILSLVSLSPSSSSLLVGYMSPTLSAAPSLSSVPHLFRPRRFRFQRPFAEHTPQRTPHHHTTTPPHHHTTSPPHHHTTTPHHHTTPPHHHTAKSPRRHTTTPQHHHTTTPPYHHLRLRLSSKLALRNAAMASI